VEKTTLNEYTRSAS